MASPGGVPPRCRAPAPAARAAAVLALLVLAPQLSPAAAADPESPLKAVVDVLLGDTPEAAQFREKAGISGDPAVAAIDLKAICPTTKAINALGPAGNTAVCTLIGLTEVLIADAPRPPCGNKTATGYGRQEQPPTQGVNNTTAPQPLVNRMPVPQEYAGAARAEVLAAEGPTYAWLWANIVNIYFWWPCAKSLGGSLDFLFPTGWAGVGGNSPTDGPGVVASGVGEPYIVMMRKAESLVIFMRGTNSPDDWSENFQYDRLKRARLDKSNRYKGTVFHGYYRMINSTFWAPVRDALDSEVVRGGVTNLVFAGHSQGAAITMLLAYAAANHLKAAGKGDVVVNAVGFATPLVGDTKFTNELTKRVNARQLLFINDVVPDFPCPSNRGDGANSMPACARVLVPTRTKARQSGWPDYQRLWGQIWLTAQDEPIQQDLWATTNLVTLATAGRRFIETHRCSYQCFLSTFVTDFRDATCILDGSTVEGYTKCLSL